MVLLKKASSIKLITIKSSNTFQTDPLHIKYQNQYGDMLFNMPRFHIELIWCLLSMWASIPPSLLE